MSVNITENVLSNTLFRYLDLQYLSGITSEFAILLNLTCFIEMTLDKPQRGDIPGPFLGLLRTRWLPFRENRLRTNLAQRPLEKEDCVTC